MLCTQVIGILTDTDIIKKTLGAEVMQHPSEVTAADVMTANPARCIRPQGPAHRQRRALNVRCGRCSASTHGLDALATMVEATDRCVRAV